VGTSLGEAERRLILATLECDGDKKKAAEILGISLKTLYNRPTSTRRPSRAASGPASRT
jgi:DNA-binding NtrC family response regulator